MASAAATKAWDQVISGPDIIAILDYSDLTYLDDVFTHLGMERNDINNAQIPAKNPDRRTQSKSILGIWCDRKGSKATRREFIKAAMQIQNYTSSLDELKRIWNTGKPCASLGYDVPGSSTDTGSSSNQEHPSIPSKAMVEESLYGTKKKKKKKKKSHRHENEQGEPCASIGYDLPGSSTDTGSGSRMTIDFDETSSKRGVTVSSNQEHGLHAASQVNDQSIPSKAMVDEPLQGTKKKKKRKSHLRENEQETDRLHQLNPSSTKVKKKERQTHEVPWQFAILGGEKHKRSEHIVMNNDTKDIEPKPCHQPRDNNRDVKQGRQPADLDFRRLTYKLINSLDGPGNSALFKEVKWMFNPEVPHEKTEHMTAPQFVQCLQEPEYQELDKYNLEHLYDVMNCLACDYKCDFIVKEIEKYSVKHAKDPLHTRTPNRTKAMDTIVVEVVLDRDINECSVNDVNKHKNNLHASTGVPKSKIQCIGIGCGCTVLVFQLPLRWPEDQSEGGAKIDVRGRINNDIIQKADWLMDSDVIGIHIEGQDYIDLTGISSKGSEKMELTSDKEEQKQNITMMEDLTLEEMKPPSDEQDEASMKMMEDMTLEEKKPPSDEQDEASDPKSIPEILKTFKAELRNHYQREMGQLPLFPLLEDNEHIDIFVDLELAKERMDMRPVKLEHYEDLVTLRHPTKRDAYAKRVLVLGEAGSGKTNLMSKLAYSWSQGHTSLAQFELVFYLEMRSLHSCNDARHCLRRGAFDIPHGDCGDCDLIHEIIKQMPETRVNVHALHDYMKLNEQKNLILLDGWDESVLDYEDLMKANIRVPNHDIENILSGKKYPSSCVIVTSRPYKSMGKIQAKYTAVNLRGFSEQNVNEYIRKFFQMYDDREQALVSQLKTSGTLFNLSRIPVMLMMICWMWSNPIIDSFPKQRTELYLLFAEAIWKRYCYKQGFDNMLESDMSMALETVGNVALQGILQERRVFDMREINKSSANLGLQLGLLIEERRNLHQTMSSISSVSFIHKTFQDFCAAYHLTNTLPDLEIFVQSLDSWDAVLSKQELLLFCCGLLSKMPGNDGATNIIQHAIACFVKYSCENMMHEISVGKNHAIYTECNILPVLEMISESGQTYHDALMKPVRDLIVFNKLSVHCTHPQTLPVFHQFVLSKLGYSLCNIQAIRFDHHSLVSLNAISDTLRCMPSVHSITLNFSNSTGVASETSMTQLSECIASLSKLSTLSVRHAHNGLDIGVIFHHLSQSSCKTLKYLHFEDTHVGDAIAHMVGFIPHLESITFRDVAFEYRHMASLCDLLPNAPCLLELDLLGNSIGNDALHVLFTHIHHLARLQLLVISAIVDCHCSPLVKECLVVAGKYDIPVEACAISLLYEEDVIQSLLSISRIAATKPIDFPKPTQT